MKKIVILCISGLLLTACKKVESNQQLQLIGTVEGLKKGTLYVQKFGDSTLVNIDTIHINGSSDFQIQLDIKEPEMLQLMLDRGATHSKDDQLPFFAEPGHIRIATSLEAFSAGKITGSANQKIYDEFKTVSSRFNDQDLALIQKGFKAYKNKNQAQLDSVNLAQKEVLKRRYLYVVNFALNHRNREIAPYVVLTEIPNVGLKYLDTIQKSMPEQIKKSLYGQKIIELYKARVKSGT
jgi:hypothetical protein